MNWPMIRSLRPSPYTSAVSKNVTPDSTAARSTAKASASVTDPQSAPSCQVPRPMIETGLPVLPRTRCSIYAILGPALRAPHSGRRVGPEPAKVEAQPRLEARVPGRGHGDDAAAAGAAHPAPPGELGGDRGAEAA